MLPERPLTKRRAIFNSLDAQYDASQAGVRLDHLAAEVDQRSGGVCAIQCQQQSARDAGCRPRLAWVLREGRKNANIHVFRVRLR
jgi:hypothetical protein